MPRPCDRPGWIGRVCHMLPAPIRVSGEARR
jgi:hypothetical protein